MRGTLLITCLGLASCHEARTLHGPPQLSPANDDAKLRFNRQRGVENQYRAGVDHFAAMAGSRPEMNRVAVMAASAGLAFCERSRPTFFCLDENVQRFQAAMHDLRPHALPVPDPPVQWAIQAPPSCDAVVAAIAVPPVPPRSVAPIAATLTLRTCQITSTHTAWSPSACPSAAAVCGDGSTPIRSMSSCGDGRPCQPSPPTCPCQTATLPVHIEVEGSWAFAGHTEPFHYAADTSGQVLSLRTGTLPEPQNTSALEIAQLHLGSLLVGLNRALAVFAATDADELAVRCANLTAEIPADPVGALQLASARCTTAYLRDPIASPALATSPARACRSPGPPTIAAAPYPYRVRVIDACERAAIQAEIEQRSPGWRVEIGVLGYVVRATRTATPPRAEDPLAMVSAFTAANRAYLGFEQVPPVAEGGGVYAGTLIAVGSGKNAIQFRAAGDRVELVTPHPWPVSCPAFDENALVAPWLGAPIAITTPGTPCDRVAGARCTSRPPSERPARLTRRHLGLDPRFVLLRGDRGDQLELHCGVEIRLLSGIEARGPQPRPLPAVVEAATGATLEDAISEAPPFALPHP